MNFIDIIIQIEMDSNKNGKYYFLKMENEKTTQKSRKVIFKGKTLRLISIIVWDLSTLLPHIFHEMKNTPVGPARTRRQGREKRTQRSRILPSIEIVTTCHGRNFPLARSASRAACSSPPQHGTSMRTMVTL